MLDNFVTSALQEDHLSLGTSAALKLQRLLGNLYQILGIEYLLAAQGLDFHEPQKLAAGTRRARDLLRESVPGWEDDRWLAPDIASAVALRWPRAGVRSAGEVNETTLFAVFAPGVGGESLTEMAGNQTSGQVVQR